jgi:amino acid transporter
MDMVLKLASLIGIVLFFLLSFINKLPRKFINYPYKITSENEERQHENTIMMLAFLRTLLTLMFSYLTYYSIQTGLGKAEGLGSHLTLIFLGLTGLIIGCFIVRGYQLR